MEDRHENYERKNTRKVKLQTRWAITRSPECTNKISGNVHKDARPFEKCAQTQKQFRDTHPALPAVQYPSSTTVEGSQAAGWVTYCSICTSTMLRAQNRAGKGSILLWRRFIFPIFLLFIYGFYWWLNLQKVRETKLSLPQIKIIKIYLD